MEVYIQLKPDGPPEEPHDEEELESDEKEKHERILSDSLLPQKGHIKEFSESLIP